MRLATVFDELANEPRPVFELPGGSRIDLRALFQPASDSSEPSLETPPLFFTDLAKTVEYLDDVTDAVRQWSRQRAERVEQTGGAPLELSAVDRMPFLPPVPIVRALREFDTFEAHVAAWREHYSLPAIDVTALVPAFEFGNAAALVGHRAAVFAPAESSELDYGMQIAAVIGRGGNVIATRDAWDHIAGFTIVNRFVARDLERQEMIARVAHGASRGFAIAVGPYLVSLGALRDRIDHADRLHLSMRASVNGKEISRSDAATMTHTWPQLIERASRDAMLYPGDLVTSGTSGGGCVLDRQHDGDRSAKWLEPGDVVELEIERLGALRTPITRRPAAGEDALEPTSSQSLAGV